MQDRVIVHHRHEWARGTKVSGLAGRVYSVDETGQLCDSDGPGVTPEDAEEFRQFAVFRVAPAPKKAPPPPPPAPPAEPPTPVEPPIPSEDAEDEDGAPDDKPETAEKPKPRKRK